MWLCPNIPTTPHQCLLRGTEKIIMFRESLVSVVIDRDGHVKRVDQHRIPNDFWKWKAEEDQEQTMHTMDRPS